MDNEDLQAKVDAYRDSVEAAACKPGLVSDDGPIAVDTDHHRGAFGISLDDHGQICVKHRDKFITLNHSDLDELVESLIKFRKAMQAGGLAVK